MGEERTTAEKKTASAVGDKTEVSEVWESQKQYLGFAEATKEMWEGTWA